jgi:glutamyl-tRNA reductase
MPPKTNEDYMREIRNIQPAHPLVYERIEQILTEKDKQREEAVAEARRDCLEVFEDLTTWYNTNNQIPLEALDLDNETYDMIKKAIKDSLKEVFERAKKHLTPPTN